jgi:hypothetical protein
MNNLEECIKTMLDAQERTHDKIVQVAEKNEQTNQAVCNLINTVNEHKKEDKKEKKEIRDMILAFRTSLAVADRMMDQMQENSYSKSPPRKIARPTLPPESQAEDAENSDDDSAHTLTSSNAPRSDDDSTVAAGGN